MIRESEDVLFQEWRSARAGFVADGAADQAVYAASGKRLLFMLKEVNDPDGGSWDLREYMREGARSQTWNNITRWIEGIRNLSTEMPWHTLELVDHDRRMKALRSVAAVNIKKSPGGHTSDPSKLAIIANQDRAFLNRQVAIYDADLVICCGVSDTFHWLVDFSSPPKWKRTSRGIAFHEYKPQKYVVAYAHPEARVAACILYYGLIDAIREILA